MTLGSRAKKGNAKRSPELERVAAMIEYRDNAEQALEDAVTEAQDAGHSLRQIAEVFGVTKQTLWRKYFRR